MKIQPHNWKKNNMLNWSGWAALLGLKSKTAFPFNSLERTVWFSLMSTNTAKSTFLCYFQWWICNTKSSAYLLVFIEKFSKSRKKNTTCHFLSIITVLLFLFFCLKAKGNPSYRFKPFCLLLIVKPIAFILHTKPILGTQRKKEKNPQYVSIII